MTITHLHQHRAPRHPGEVLKSDFLQGFGITRNKLAVSIGVPPRRVTDIVQGKRAIDADIALRLSRFFGTSPQFWLELQAQYDLEVASQAAASDLATITPLKQSA